MAAHLPRRVFAPSFVVTVATVALVGGCQSKEPAPQSPTIAAPSAPPTSSGAPPEGVTGPEPIHVNPPPPALSGSAAPSDGAATSPVPFTEDRAWTIRRETNGICDSQEEIGCDPGRSCNPPRPAAYDCPKEVRLFPARVTARKGSTECHVKVMGILGGCPPGAQCNPPPPHDVAVPCPE